MRQRNLHSFSPTSVGGRLCLAVSYTPPLIALGIMLVVMVPFLNYFCLRLLWHSTIAPLLFWYSFVVGVAVFALLIFTFWKCVSTSPGYVDSSVWVNTPTVRNALQSQPTNRFPSHSVTQLSRDGLPRMCAICETYKPDDAHHCHDCGKCVERMDHHCPWINNCVGRETEKYFLLFLFYIPVCAAHVAISITAAVQWGVVKDTVDMLLMILIAVGAAIFGVVLCCFGSFHLFMLLRGITTIDFVVLRRQGTAIPQAALKRQEVLESVFGSDRRWWRIVLPLPPTRLQPTCNSEV